MEKSVQKRDEKWKQNFKDGNLDVLISPLYISNNANH